MKLNHLPFSLRCVHWARKCFGFSVVQNTQERCHRFLEEALELCQALDMPASDAHALVEYVYGRPKGSVPQEIGGAYITLAVLSASIYENLDACGEAELARCWEKIDKIRQKQANKPKGALPQ